MNDDRPEALEDRLASLLADCDEALAAGASAPAVEAGATPELRARLERGLVCMRALRQVLPRQAADTPSPTIVPAAEVPSLPECLGRFQLRGELGRGGFGVVFLAHDPQLGREVALKVPRADALASPELRERFVREARAAAALDHPNLVPVYEAGEAGPVCYIASAYCPGPTLDQWLKGQREPVPARTAALLVQTLAGAVHHAHQRGVVHRDLKPANILLASGGCQPPEGDETKTPSGGSRPPLATLTPKITDFGLAKVLGDGGEAAPTRSGAVVGTPSYMAPEQARGRSKQVGPLADVWALGAVLYECLTGRPPFRGETALDTLLAVQNEEPVPPSRLRAKLPRDLETVCLKCLEKDPHRRYDSAQALADDLRRFLAGEPVQARPVGPGGRLWRWCRRNRTLAAVSALAASALLGGLVLSVALAVTESRNAAAESRNAERLAEERDRTFTAYEKATEQKALAERREREARRESALLALERGLGLCDQGETGSGLLWLARGLRHAARAGDPEFERVVRTTLAGWGHEVHPLRAILAHPEGGARVFVSPGGALLTTSPTTARWWEMATGKLLRQHPVPWQGSVAAVAFGPDGKTALTGSLDHTARLWDVATGRAISPLFRHDAEVVAVALSPDGKTALTGSRDGTARLWDAATGRPKGPPLVHDNKDRTGEVTGRVAGPPQGYWSPDRPNTVNDLAFSPDGKVVLTGSDDFTARLWEVATGRPVGQVMRHRNFIRAVAFGPDGKTVATGSDDSTARLWSAETGRPVSPPLQHQDLGQIALVAFGPDGKTLLTASRVQTAQLWQVAPVQRIGRPLWHPEEVVAIAFSPDGRTVLTASRDKAARLWEVATGQALGAPLRHAEEVDAVAFTPDGKTLVTSGRDQTVRLWGAPAGGVRRPPMRHEDHVKAVAFSPDGKTLVTANGFHRQGRARLWSAATGELLVPPLEHEPGLSFAVFSPDGKTLLAGGHKTARLWDVATGKPRGRVLEHQDYIRTGAFSPDGKTALTAGGLNERGECRLWDAATGEPRGPALRKSGTVERVAFSPDGKLLAADGGPAARVWSVSTGEPFGPPLKHEGWVKDVAFSPDGKTLVTASHDRTARLWEVATGRPLGRPLQHRDGVSAVAFSPDGKSVLTGSEDNTARLWDAATGDPRGPSLRHQGAVRALGFSPDGRVLLTGSNDGTARLWDTVTCHSLGPPLRHRGAVQTVAFGPDSRSVLTGSWDQTARLWPVPPPAQGEVERVARWAREITGMEMDEYDEVRVSEASSQLGSARHGPPAP